MTGSNFAGFGEYDLDTFIDLPFGIAEIDRDGTAIITKHENTKGVVNEDVVRCQFLYELQGGKYLNSTTPFPKSVAYIELSVQAMSKRILKTL